jgi:hypothetical protein
VIPSKQEVIEILAKCNTVGTPSKEVAFRAAAYWANGWFTVYAWQKKYNIKVLRGAPTRTPQVMTLPSGRTLIFAREEIL